MDYNVTSHAVQRYWQRVDLARTLTVEEVEQRIKERANQGAFIYEGVLNGDPEPRKYILDDDLLLVISPEGNVVTVFKTEYGFDDELDKIIRRRLAKSIGQLHAKIAKGREVVQDTVDAVDVETANIRAKIDQLKAEIQLLEDAKATLEAKKKEAYSVVSALNAQLYAEARKLIYTKNYAIEFATPAAGKINAKK